MHPYRAFSLALRILQYPHLTTYGKETDAWCARLDAVRTIEDAVTTLADYHRMVRKTTGQPDDWHGIPCLHIDIAHSKISFHHTFKRIHFHLTWHGPEGAGCRWYFGDNNSTDPDLENPHHLHYGVTYVRKLLREDRVLFTDDVDTIRASLKLAGDPHWEEL